MRKRFLVMILFILLLTGCGKRTEITDFHNSKKENMFVYIQTADGFHDYDVVYQKDTKVMYTVSHGPYSYGSFTLLVNPDGTPMLYETDEKESENE